MVLFAFLLLTGQGIGSEIIKTVAKVGEKGESYKLGLKMQGHMGVN